MDCIREGEDQCYIDPDICIDCGACLPVCPVDAIYTGDGVPAEEQPFIDKNAQFFRTTRRRRTLSGPGDGPAGIEGGGGT